MRTTATRKGDKWVINGSKCFITNGGYANFFTVYAKTDKEKGHRGISCFIVPKDDTVTVDKKEDKMGQRASNTATITFNDTEIPLDHLVGEENKGFKLAMMTLDRTRPGVAAMATGIARAAFEFATAYSKERVQFGVPIAMHQGIQFLIADMATKVHLSRLAAWHSAVLLDQGKRNTLESSHAKRFAADSAMEVTTDAVQVYGGYGFIKDYPVEKLMRDAKIMQLYEGTSQIQRLVIARETLLPRRIEEPDRRLIDECEHDRDGDEEPLRSWDHRRRLGVQGVAAGAPGHRLRLARELPVGLDPAVADREHAPERAAGRRGHPLGRAARGVDGLRQQVVHQRCRVREPDVGAAQLVGAGVDRGGRHLAAEFERRRRGQRGGRRMPAGRNPDAVLSALGVLAYGHGAGRQLGLREPLGELAQALGAAGERRARVGVLLAHQQAPLDAVRFQPAGRAPEDGEALVGHRASMKPRMRRHASSDSAWKSSWRRSKKECGAPGRCGSRARPAARRRTRRPGRA